MYTGDLWLQLWLKNRCKNTGYYSTFHLSLLLLLNNYQYNYNNTISSVSLEWFSYHTTGAQHTTDIHDITNTSYFIFMYYSPSWYIFL